MAFIKKRILVVDDEEQIRRFIRLELEEKDFEVAEAPDGKTALAILEEKSFDLVLLDLHMPGLDGFLVLQKIREKSSLPVIVLTVKSAETSKVLLLENGADDYITKPFSLPELVARVGVALRHSSPASVNQIIELGRLKIDLDTRTVNVDNKSVKLSPKEYSLLVLLAQNAGRVLTNHQIMRKIWGIGMENDTQYLRVYIGSLRKKIEADPANPKIIINEPAVGYRLIMPE